MKTRRQMIDEVKGMVKDTRCLDKLVDAIADTIFNHADSHCEDFGTDQTTMRIALEEIILGTDYSDEEELSEYQYGENEIEEEVRLWMNMPSEDTVVLANSVMALHEGYRCEKENVPITYLNWARVHEDGNR